MDNPSDHLLATANTVTELLSAGDDRCSRTLESHLASLRECVNNKEPGTCWQALALLWPVYTQTATNVLKSHSEAVSDSLWWSLHHAVHGLAQHCQGTEEVNLTLSQLGLYAAQVRLTDAPHAWRDLGRSALFQSAVVSSTVLSPRSEEG